MNKKISIALTTFNGERFLRQQLDSLLSQTLMPDEIIVSDEHSSDSTQNILQEYADKYPCLHFSVNAQPLGVNANFFRAISLCKGDYILICDQDDVWMPHKIETLVKALDRYVDRQDIPVVCSSLIQDVDQQLRPLGPPRSFPEGSHWTDTLINTEHSQGCTMIMNRQAASMALSLYRSSPLADTVLYDVLISCTAAVFGIKHNLPDVLMYYRHHDRNVVDPLQTSRKSFWDKVREMPTYYPFLLDYRIRELSVLSELVKDMEVRPEIRLFLEKMHRLHLTRSIFRGLPIVLGLPEISLTRKMKVFLLTPIVKTLKLIAS